MRTAGRHPQPRDFERRAEGDQRRSAVRQRGIPVDQRGAADLEGGAAIAQRGADRAQQPASGNAGAAAHHLQRSAERPLQHRCRDAVPRHQPQHPLLHAGHQVAVQRHSRRHRPAARRSQLAGRRRRALLADARTVLQDLQRRSSARSKRRAAPGTCAASCPTAPRTTESKASSSPSPTSPSARHTADALEAAKPQAEQANVAKSRFLAAASHDLRQPLQTLSLLAGAAGARRSKGERRKNLVARLDETLGAMSGMLNTLLDINQIEAGIVQAEMVSFPISDLFDRLREEFAYHAQAQGLVPARRPVQPFDPQRSAPARADDPQPAVERPEIHQAAARCCSAAAGAGTC